MEAEGWYVDPFSLHGDRWFSDGRPTALVRDDGRESHDPPPDRPFRGPLVEATVPEAENGDDLRRVGDAGTPDVYDPERARDAALDASAWGSIT
ncbi:MAG TPA: hypothetical protein VN791_05040 [Acidimicrobiales bacterium]|nr:hypothetical protein [Acidimicrobiales bacterium]